MDDARRRSLYAAKLGALVRERWGEGDREPGTFAGGATLTGDGVLWVLAEESPERALGGALALARRESAEEVHVLVEHEAGRLARRATAFNRPPRVWQIDGRQLEPAMPTSAEATPTLTPAGVQDFVPMILETGATPILEGGQLRAEVLGLEVGRVTVDELGAFLEVGVGKHDREAHRMVHGDLPPLESLRSAVASVRRVRHAEALPQEMNQVAEARWLRSLLVDRPHLVAAMRLWPVAPPVDRQDLRLPTPAPAAGDGLDGDPLLVVCSTGVDVDLVPAAAEVWLADERSPRLRLVVPEKDDHPVTRALAAQLLQPADIVVVPADWKARYSRPA